MDGLCRGPGRACCAEKRNQFGTTVDIMNHASCLFPPCSWTLLPSSLLCTAFAPGWWHSFGLTLLRGYVDGFRRVELELPLAERVTE